MLGTIPVLKANANFLFTEWYEHIQDEFFLKLTRTFLKVYVHGNHYIQIKIYFVMQLISFALGTPYLTEFFYYLFPMFSDNLANYRR